MAVGIAFDAASVYAKELNLNGQKVTLGVE
jgi:hypothetical protein